MQAGRTQFGQIGISDYSALSNNSHADFKVGGITVDVAFLTAVGIGANAIATVAVSGGAGTFTVSVTRGGSTQTTAAQAYNVALATLEDVLQSLSNVGNGNIQVSGTPGTSYVIEAVEDIGKSPVTFASLGSGGATATTTLTQTGALPGDTTFKGGTIIPAGVKAVDAGTPWFRHTTGLYRPATNATTLVPGETYVSNKAFIEPIHTNQFGEVFDMGLVKFGALAVGGAGQPTLTALLAACPGIRLSKEDLS